MKKLILYYVFQAMIFPIFAQTPTINPPQKTATIILDNNSNTKADPNDQIRYKTTITNSGAGNATGVIYTVSIDGKTTLVAGSFKSSPLAVNDAYACTGNVGITVPAASGLMANDFDDAPAGLTCTAGTFATTQSGSITISANGSFTYSPPVGFTGTDTYPYTLNDGNAVAGVAATDNATITFTVSNMIWFIDNLSVAATSDGRLSSPFKTLANFNAATTLAGQLIFIKNTGTNYTGGIVLKNTQTLLGTGHTGGSNLADVLPFSLAANSNALPAINGTRPGILNSSGDGIALASGNVIRGVDIGNCSDFGIDANNLAIGALTLSEVTIINTTGGGFRADNGSGTLEVSFTSISSTGGANGINLTNCAGTFTVGGGTISNPTGTGVLVSGGTVALTTNTNITDNSGFAIDVDNHDSGNVTFQVGNITSTANGIRVQNCGGGTITFSGTSKSLNTGANSSVTLASNTGATINFTGGGLILNSTSAIAFNATGGGTITVQGTGNTITSTTGIALNVTSTTIGASGLTFLSIAANGATKGIVLNSTGSSGGLSVTGTGTTDGTGGTIQNISTRGVEFISGISLSLKNMTFTNACTADFPAAPTGLSLGVNTADNAVIHLQNATNVTLDNIDITGSAEQGINGHNVNGFSLLNSTITNAGNGPDEDGLHFFNMSGTSAITNTSITSSGDDNVNIQNNTNLSAISTVGTINITGGSFNTGVQGSGLLFGMRGTTNTTLNISNLTINNNFSGGVVADTYDTATSDVEVSGCTITNNNDAISISSHNGNTIYDIHDNPNLSLQDFVNISVLKSAFSNAGSLSGKIRNNSVTTENGHAADGIFVWANGGGLSKTSITNNNLNYAGTQRAIIVQGAQDGAATFEATITGNVIDVKLDGTGNAVNAILAQSQVASPSGDGSTLCVDIGGTGGLANTITHSLGGTLVGGDIRVRQRFESPIKLPGYGGGSVDTAAVQAYLDGRNVEVSLSTASAFLGSGAFLGGSACQQP